ncbi:MAG: C2 family cysteine protease [Thermoguttaceae bacterium]
MIRDFFRSRSSGNKKKTTTKRILRAEILEPRTLLSATVLSGEMQQATYAVNSATYAVTAAAPANHAPTVSKAAAAASNPVTGKTVQLSVLGADDGGENNLKYAWTTSSFPSGAPVPTFSVNGTNAAKNTTVTFKTAGTYSFTATIIDAGKLYVTSSVKVTVNQTISSITVIPSITNILVGGTQQFSATGYDQFGSVLKTQPTFTWTTTLGTIDNSHVSPGLLTAPGVGGIGTVTATVGLIKGTASMRVVGNLAVTHVAAATSNPVTGATVQLSVLGSDGADESNIKYTWTMTSSLNGSPAPTFSVNGSNAAKTTTVTFKAADTYFFTATLVDTAGHTASSNVMVIVNSTVTKIVVNPGTATLSAGGTQQFSATGYDQFGKCMTTQPTFTWTAGAGTITSAGFFTAPPITASATVRAAAGGISGTANVTDINHAPTVAVPAAAASNPVTGTSVQLSVLGADDAGEGNLYYCWTPASIPNGASAPTFSKNWTNAAKNTTVTFYQAGTYIFTAIVLDAGNLAVSSSVTVVVNQTFTSVQIYAPSQVIYPGLSLQCYAWTLDQFYSVMTPPSPINWWSSAGSITSNGLFYAFAPPGNVTITASSGGIQASTTITVINSTNFLGLYDSTLANLTQSLFVDGSIDRQDMIDILQSVCPAANGTLGQVDYHDLQTIMSKASTLNMPGYVQALANDVINGSYANAWYQGQRLGNLTYLTTGANFTNLIDKWFYGTDYPVIDANVPAGQTYSYTSVSGSLFNAATGGIPSHADEFQGLLGDCYFITALGTLADSSPAAIRNMFVDNGDGTWTVRFYSGSTVNYVTVDRMLPTDSSGALVYADFGMTSTDPTNTLWIPLAEKAFVELNEINQLGAYGTNCYSSIQGGCSGDVYADVLGYSANFYGMSNPQPLINAVNNHLAVSIGTNGTTDPTSGLHTGHAYGVIGYDSQSGTFTLYNPCGFDQPGPLTWTQLQQNCAGFQTADPAGSIPISAIPQFGALPRTLAITQIIITNAPQNRHAFSAEQDLLPNQGQEPDSIPEKVLKVRDRLFASQPIQGSNVSAINTSWVELERNGQSSKTSRNLYYLSADEFFGEIPFLELVSNNPVPLWERLC